MKQFVQLGACSAVIVLGLAGAAWAHSDYARDAITAIAPSRLARTPTGTCTVWANAEGLGVGPAQLAGLHGVTVSLNVRPVAGESPLALATGLALAKAAQPTAPAWMFAAIEKNRPAIEAACAKDSSTPIMIRKLTAGDKG